MDAAIKVAHIVLSLDVGGLERNVVNQVREGQTLGQEVSVVCLERSGVLAPRIGELGGRCISLDKRPGVEMGLVRRLSKVFSDLKVNVVHTHQIGGLFYAGPAARRARVPLVVHTQHGLIGLGEGLRTRLLACWAGRYARRFYCLNRNMAEVAVRHRVVPRERVRVILNGIDTAAYATPCDTACVRAALGLPDDAVTIGVVARLDPVKRLDTLIRVFAKIHEWSPRSHLLIVGDGPLRGFLQSLATDLGIREVVHFAGFQPSSAPYLRLMNVFVLTSESEGTPQAVLEAMVVGVPVIASKVGGLPELIDHNRNGLLVEPGGEEELARAIRSVLTDAGLSRFMAAEGRRRAVEKFDISRMAKEYHRDFADLLRAGSSAA